jgi:hypothetical protein
LLERPLAAGVEVTEEKAPEAGEPGETALLPAPVVVGVMNTELVAEVGTEGPFVERITTQTRRPNTEATARRIKGPDIEPPLLALIGAGEGIPLTNGSISISLHRANKPVAAASLLFTGKGDAEVKRQETQSLLEKLMTELVGRRYTVTLENQVHESKL